MTFITSETKKFHTIRPGDKHFKIPHNIMSVDRASIEISQSCPNSIARVILDAYEKGWIKPIANISDRELLFAGLANEI